MFSPTILGQVVVNGVSLSAIYILVALGFTLLFGIMRVVNFAHGEFAMLGAFALYYLMTTLHLPWLIALPIAVVGVAAASMVLEWAVFRWFYQRMFESMIGLLGLSMMLMFGGVLIWDVYDRNIPAAFTSVLVWGDIILPVDRLVVLVIAVAALVGFYLFIRFTRAGLAMRAAAQDVEIAETQGVDTRRTYKVAFFVAILLAALAGALWGQIYSVSPFLGQRPLMMAFIVVILGGMGSIPGAALGGTLLGFTESFVGTFYGTAASAFLSFGIVVLLLIVRPWGILGTPEA
ncbi:MAG TPA: branched-chain amino acid ABC transporter permease [Candidatus Sulfotelmatobacter sp.]|nr:branched-chain amino acid ABC transporter permease [Candidatus Sulfotelmatobacter sp.]